MRIRQIVLCAILAVAVVGLLTSCMEMALWSENLKSLDIYGRVVDQDGAPVVGAKVEGSIGLNVSMVASGGKSVYTETDSQGRFHFWGIHGAGMGIFLQREGYFYNQKIPTPRPGSYKLDSKNPVVFTMWKIHGAETLTKFRIDAKIFPNGTPTTFEIATGKESANGDLRVTLIRSPLEVQRGRGKFNWTAKIEMVHGGIVEENDPYPYVAPEMGYQPDFEFNVSSNDVPWHPYLDRNFYVKNAQGQYGVMKLHVNGSVSPVRLKTDFTVNPSGSRNLEPDFSK